jgi:RND family efflux transporter MFP subunit
LYVPDRVNSLALAFPSPSLHLPFTSIQLKKHLTLRSEETMTFLNKQLSSRFRRGIAGGSQIIAIFAAIFVAIVFSREDAQAVSDPEPFRAAALPVASPLRDDPDSAPLVRVIDPTAQENTLTIGTTGSVGVRSYVNLVPEVSGRVVEVSRQLRAGGRISPNAMLLRIDPREYQLALDAAEADLASAQSRLLLRRAEAEAAINNYALLNPGAAVPPLVAKVPQINQAMAETDAARARVERARLDLDRTIISLPFAGRISDASIEVGQMLNQGQSFGRAYSSDSIEISVPLSQDDIARLENPVGRFALVRASGKELRARVERVAAELDERTRFGRLYLSFDTDQTLPPGTFVEVKLIGPGKTDTFLLPESAEQSTGQLWQVSAGRLQLVTPNILARTSEGLVVEAFSVDQGVVIGGVPEARPGKLVRTAPEA